MNISYIPMVHGHIEQILLIEALSFPTPWSEQAFIHELEDNDLACYVVAMDGEKVVGYGGMWMIMDEAHLTNVAVHPQYRGQQIGAGILKRLINIAAQKGVTRMTLEVRVSNTAARKLYEKLGFVKSGLRKGYYTDTKEDAIIMWKDGISRHDQTSYLLAIETSCDETSAALIADGREVLANIISSQVPVHQKFGGVVPEIASRKHVELVNGVIQEAMEQGGKSFRDLSAIAVTYGPGLVGALLVGLSTAKALAYALNLPLIGVNHIEGHIYANFLAHPQISFPLVCLVVSGGHSDLVYMEGHGKYEILGRTRDDAAGEAFDKVARALDLGYPGGPLVSQLAQEGNDQAVPLPRAYLEPDSLDFSFSGLKSAVLNYLNRAEQKGEPVNKADLAAGFQKSVTDVLVDKTIQAALRKKVKNILLAGGVAANRQLRENLDSRSQEHGLQIYYPPPILCTDNAAMIGAAAYHKHMAGLKAGLTLNAIPNLKLGVEEY